MAKTTVELITDDIDGTEDASTYTFAFQGTQYSIDLSEENAKALEEALQPYIDVATKVSGRSSSRRSSSSSKRDFSVVRDWAKSQGLEVSERGRIPRSILEQYDASH